MSNIVEADYQIVQERTLPVIIGEIKIIEQKMARNMMEGSIDIGERLQEAKQQVGHGNFDQWCQENLNYTRRTAENFMRIASLLEQIDQLERRASNAASEAKVEFKILMDQLQRTWSEAIRSAHQADTETEQKMLAAMRTVADKLKKELEA